MTIARLNINGLRVQPCRVPRLSWNGFDFWLLVQTEATGVKYMYLIHEMKFEPNPNLSSTADK